MLETVQRLFLTTKIQLKIYSFLETPSIDLPTPCPPCSTITPSTGTVEGQENLFIVAVDMDPEFKIAVANLFVGFLQLLSAANRSRVSSTDDRINPVLNSSPPLGGITVSAEPCKDR